MAGMSGMATGPLGISMDRMGSGTTWIPDAAPLPSRHRTTGGWDLMLHGFVFGQFDRQTGERGGDQFGSLNWEMFMASHAFAGGQFQARTMLSLDPATVTSRGYPLLLQTGESYQGAPLYDRQHPHDFWMELGVLYERPVSSTLALSLYAAPSGEPALGPVAFMHRPSAMDNPTAPLGHHWQDATHITFGVTTIGLFSQRWKIEGSAFNGREPNDHRWDFDHITLDSYAGRLTVNPSEHWSLSGGYGYLKSPEALNPTESVHRVTLSAMHGKKLGTEGQWASSLIAGMNRPSGVPRRSTKSILGETEAVLNATNTILARAEMVEKTADELVLPPIGGLADPDRRFTVSALSLGYIREIARGRGVTFGVGALGTLNMLPRELESAYGSRTPTGVFVFLRVRPYHEGMGGMHHLSGMIP
jgi:hypothetical protein